MVLKQLDFPITQSNLVYKHREPIYMKLSIFSLSSMQSAFWIIMSY
jgi:hypothetical protein